MGRGEETLAAAGTSQHGAEVDDLAEVVPGCLLTVHRAWRHDQQVSRPAPQALLAQPQQQGTVLDVGQFVSGEGLHLPASAVVASGDSDVG